VVELLQRGGDLLYNRHDRYWIPMDHPRALCFYLDHLFVPHSRQELLRGTFARTTPWMKWSFLHPRERKGKPGSPPSLEEIGLKYLAGLLEEHLRQAGYTLSGSLLFLILEDYQNSTRRQAMLFLFDQELPVPYALAKVTRQTNQCAILKREFNTLVNLHKSLAQELRTTIPQPLAFIERDGLTVICETFLPGRSIYYSMRNTWHPRRHASHHFGQAMEWLVQFQKATLMSDGYLDEWLMREHVMRPLESFQRHFKLSTHERQMIRYVIESAHKLQGERLPLVMRQGDFWARNLIENGNKVGVVDWERFSKRSTPFSDLFMFATSYGLSYPWKLGRWAEPVTAFRATYLERSWLGQCIRDYLLAYCQAMGVSPALLEVFFPVFLAEQALKEMEQWENHTPRSGRQTWRNLIHEYAQQGGSVCFG